MARENKDNVRETETESVLRLADIGRGAEDRTKLTRRALLYGIPGAAAVAAVVLAIAGESSENARRDQALHPPLNPGPGTARVPGSLAGPRAAPAWAVKLNSEVRGVAYAAGSVLVVDDFGNVRGYDPRSGVEKWQPTVRFFSGMSLPLTVIGDTLYGYDADGDVLAVNASDGTLRWKVQLGEKVEIATTQGSAGSLVFSTGSIDGQGNLDQADGLLWAVDSTTHSVAWSIEGVDYSLAVAASEAAGVVVIADKVANHLTAYSLEGRSVLWRKESARSELLFSMAPPNCLAVSGNTVFWGADKLYALDAATGTVHWSAAGPDPADEFESVFVVPGQGAGSGDLVVASAMSTYGAGSGGTGSLSAFDAESGDPRWVQRGSAKFGQYTAVAVGGTGRADGTGVIYAAEADNGSLFAVDIQTGETRWTYRDDKATADFTWTVAADDVRAYVAYDNNLLSFEH